MGVDHDFNRVKPGHINMGRALRSLSMKTDQSRQLTLSIPAVYVKDTYGVETSTVQMPAIEIPGLNGLVSPITTKDFSLAKEGRYIAGAARIYMPSMDQIFKKLNTNTDSFYPNYPWMSQTRPVTDTNTVMKDYFRSIDGLMNAVLYDSEAIIFNSQPAIYAEGTTNWDSSTDYSSYFGAHWTPFDGTSTLSTNNDSITLTNSGTSSGYGTFWQYQNGNTNEIELADRISFEVKMSSEGFQSKFMFLVLRTNAAGSKYPFICYGSAAADGNDNLDVPADDRWYKVDLPFTSGSLTTGPTHWTNYTPANLYDGGDSASGGEEQVTGDAISILQNPTTGSLNNGTADFPWIGGTDQLFIGFRPRRPANKECSFSVRNIKFYRSIPWSVHSVKDYNTDYMVLNCVRTDGDSMQRQEAYREQVPEL